MGVSGFVTTVTVVLLILGPKSFEVAPQVNVDRRCLNNIWEYYELNLSLKTNDQRDDLQIPADTRIKLSVCQKI